MSIKDRRNAVLKSSIGLNSIRDSISSFGKGISQSISTSNDIVKQTRKSNVFKRTLIGKDNEYFRKRRENIRRKDREDELEASGVKGAAKAQGNVVSKSVKGLLGRVLNFFGIILLGWLITTLPKILNSIRGLIRRIQGLIGVLTNFVDGIRDFLDDMGQNIANIFTTLPKFDFNQGKADAEKATKEVENGLTLIRKDMFTGVRTLNKPENLGLDPKDPEGLIELDPEKDKQENKQGDDAPKEDGTDAPPKNVDTDKDIKTTDATAVSVGGKDQSELIDKKISDEISSDKLISDFESKKAQSQGETISKKKLDDEEEKDSDDVQKGIVQGINEKLNELVGGQAKRDTAKGKTVDEAELLDQGKQTLEKSVSGMKDINPLKIAANLLNPFKKKNKDADSITPNTKNRSALKRNKKRNQNTVMIVEKAVTNNEPQMASVGGGSKSGLNNIGGFNIDNEKNVVKKYSSLMLNK